MPNTTVNKQSESMAAMLAPFEKAIAETHACLNAMQMHTERVWAQVLREGPGRKPTLTFRVEVQETRSSDLRASKWYPTPAEALHDLFPAFKPAAGAKAKGKEVVACPA